MIYALRHQFTIVSPIPTLTRALAKHSFLTPIPIIQEVRPSFTGFGQGLLVTPFLDLLMVTGH